MWSEIVEFATWLLGKLFAPKGPTTADLAGQAATATTELHEEEAANAVTTKAADARAGADLGVVRAVTESGPAVDAAANQRLHDEFPGQFRD